MLTPPVWGTLMNIRNITIDREVGCGGVEIAAQIARRLNWKLIDKSLIFDIAKMAHVDVEAVKKLDEHPDPFLARVGRLFWGGGAERGVLTGDCFDCKKMAEMTRSVFVKAADEGHRVIVGRGAPYHLAERDDTFHVFLYAPRDFKIKRVRQYCKSHGHAEEVIDTADKERAAFIRQHFHIDWPERHVYHLMVNTAMGEDAAVDTILEAAGLRQPEPAFSA
ncbi:MAG: cytidylate kinase-like family protein [Acidobacteria bacterium]|nr:cytidylate kinase-like family protein [Acidobacteriota bacterium]